MNMQKKVSIAIAIVTIVLLYVTPTYGIVSCNAQAVVPLNVQADSTTSDIIMDWMPLIIQFAMLGMIIGLLKKFGKI